MPAVSLKHVSKRDYDVVDRETAKERFKRPSVKEGTKLNNKGSKLNKDPLPLPRSSSSSNGSTSPWSSYSSESSTPDEQVTCQSPSSDISENVNLPATRLVSESNQHKFQSRRLSSPLPRLDVRSGQRTDNARQNLVAKKRHENKTPSWKRKPLLMKVTFNGKLTHVDMYNNFNFSVDMETGQKVMQNTKDGEKKTPVYFKPNSDRVYVSVKLPKALRDHHAYYYQFSDKYCKVTARPFHYDFPDPNSDEDERLTGWCLHLESIVETEEPKDYDNDRKKVKFIDDDEDDEDNGDGDDDDDDYTDKAQEEEDRSATEEEVKEEEAFWAARRLKRKVELEKKNVLNTEQTEKDVDLKIGEEVLEVA
jgi:hypothetical protein